MTRDLYTNGTYSGPIVERTTKVVELGDAPAAGADMEAIAERCAVQLRRHEGLYDPIILAALREYHAAAVAPLVAERDAALQMLRRIGIYASKLTGDPENVSADDGAKIDRCMSDPFQAEDLVCDRIGSLECDVASLEAERDQWKSNAEVWQHVASESAAERWRRRFDDAVLKLGKRASEAEVERDRLRGELEQVWNSSQEAQCEVIRLLYTTGVGIPSGTAVDFATYASQTIGNLRHTLTAAQADAARLRAAWHPSTVAPQCEAGDRVLVVVTERPRHGADLQSRIILLEAEESGWRSRDDRYAGYTPSDGDYWALERDILPRIDAALAGEPVAEPPDLVLAEAAKLRDENDQVRAALKEWHTARESLSGDCASLGISGHSRDSGKWGGELARRCEPLRRFCSKLFYGQAYRGVPRIDAALAGEPVAGPATEGGEA